MEATQFRSANTLTMPEVEQAIAQGKSLRQAALILNTYRHCLKTWIAEQGKRLASRQQIDLLPLQKTDSGEPDYSGLSPEVRAVFEEPIPALSWEDREAERDYWASEAAKVKPDPGRGKPFGLEQLRLIRVAGYYGYGVRSLAPHWDMNQPNAAEKLKRLGLHTKRGNRAVLEDVRKAHGKEGPL